MQDGYRIDNMYGLFRVTDQFVLRFTEWYTKHAKSPPVITDPRFGGYIRRRPLHAVKIAMLLSASRSDDKIVTVEDFDRALDILAMTEINMGGTFRGMSAENMRVQLIGTLKQVACMFEIQRELTFAQLMQTFYQDVDKWGMERIMETLTSMGAVQKVIKTEGGIVKELYRANPNADIFKGG